jgi:radical SAM superfamily enzyme YgiQ (UPF0313 family)
VARMHDHKEVVILSVPHCEPLPLVAPVLLAACLEQQNISAKGIDFNILFIEKFSDTSFYIPFKNFLTMGHLVSPKFDPTVFRQIIRFTKNFLLDTDKQYSPKYIGLSIFSGESLDFGLLLSYLIRKYLPHVKIIAGGKGLEIFGEHQKRMYETWIEHCVVDAIVVGDAESSIIDLIKNDLSGLIFSPQQTKEDLDKFPLAKWDDYDLAIYQKLAHTKDLRQVPEEYLTVTGSKGCVRKCTFCDVQDFWPDYLYRDGGKIAEEIIYNFRKTGIRTFKFTDNLINGSISNFRRMNEVLVQEIPNEIKYRGFAIFRGRNQMPESDFALAARAGNDQWNVGVESGSEKVRWDMKKKFDNEDLDWSVQMLYKYGIRQNWLLIVGYPTETESDFEETKKLISRYAHYRDNITIQITPTFMLLSNSPLMKDQNLMEEYGLDHLHNNVGFNNKFWTSTKFIDNDYPTRSRRWKELMQLVQDEGYNFGPGMPVKKWTEEILQQDKKYHELHQKIIPIHKKK